jgi:protein-S-isoprenylcysteine O-methyltransferase Ste14
MIVTLLYLAAYFVFFAAVHSLLADPKFKRWLRQRSPYGHWYRLAFVILALVMVLPFLYLLFIVPGRVLYIVPAPWRWLMMAGQFMSALGLFGALRQTGVFSFIGLAQLGSKAEANALVKDGFYCHLRNPLFLFGAAFLWLSPIMTQSLMIFNLLTTAYFYAGARHEERSLQEEFGLEYEEYRKRVPMFFPRIRCLRERRKQLS